jgi:hypothetical protein
VRLAFRLIDQTGQTLQRSIDAPGDAWSDVSIPLTDWAGHWGGANDGIAHGAARSFVFIAENSGSKKAGAVLFDDVRVTKAPPLDYPAAKFSPDEHWYCFGAGDTGATKLAGNRWDYDFSRGATSVSIAPPDKSLLGTPLEIRLRAKGNAEGHPIHLVMATHFMFFERDVGAFSKPDADGISELVIPAPPGNGWSHHDGENDGALHGPLRLREIRLSASGKRDTGTLELIDLRVAVACDRAHACVLLGDGFLSNDSITFRASVQSLLTEPLDATLECVVRDWERKTVLTETRKVRIPPRAELSATEFKLTYKSQKFLEAEFKLSAEGIAVPAVACFVAPLESKKGGDQLDSASPFGLGIYLERYGVDPAGLKEMEQALQMAQDAGVKWSRQEFHWAFVEPERGKFDWSAFDTRVAAAKKHGIQIYGLLAYWSSWTQPYTQAGMDDFCRYAAAAAEHYRDSIQNWEVYNEPNIFFWAGRKDLYPVLLKQACAAIKRANPSAQVLGCSTCGIDTDFIKMTVNSGAPFDALTIHPYRQTLDDRGFIRELQQAAALVKRGDSVRPVWITEMGWSTYVPHNTVHSDFPIIGERGQAGYLARVYIDALASGVTPNISWYDFRNDGDDPFNFEYNMGVVRRDFSPKPSYRAYATLARVLKDKHIESEVKIADGVIAFRLAGAAGKGAVIALWSINGDRTIAVPAASRSVLIDLMGNQRDVETENGKIKVELQHEVPVLISTQE